MHDIHVCISSKYKIPMINGDIKASGRAFRYAVPQKEIIIIIIITMCK